MGVAEPLRTDGGHGPGSSRARIKEAGAPASEVEIGSGWREERDFPWRARYSRLGGGAVTGRPEHWSTLATRNLQAGADGPTACFGPNLSSYEESGELGGCLGRCLELFYLKVVSIPQAVVIWRDCFGTPGGVQAASNTGVQTLRLRSPICSFLRGLDPGISSAREITGGPLVTCRF